MNYPKFARFALIFFCNLLCMLSYAAESSVTKDKPVPGNSQTTLQVFYKEPTYAKFMNSIKSLSNEPKASNLLLIFSTMAIDKHPDFAEQISKNFMQYSQTERELLFAALIADNQNDSVNLIKSKYHFSSTKTSPFTAQDIKALTINDNPNHLDILWAAYFATGESQYIKRIIDYINSDSYMLFMGYEIINRKFICEAMEKIKHPYCEKSNHYEDLMEAIKKKYPNNSQQMIYKAIVFSAALWSLEANRRQDERVDKIIKEIIQQNPNLDYWKKIKATIE